jgi:hypothetical protein
MNEDRTTEEQYEVIISHELRTRESIIIINIYENV